MPFQTPSLLRMQTGETGLHSGRRMSITNAMDILRDRLMRAIKRKHNYVIKIVTCVL